MNDSLNVNKLAFMGFGLTSLILLNDKNWQYFGFKKKPNRGKIFSFLVPKQKLKLERFLTKELFSLCVIDIADSIKELEKYNTDFCDYRVLILSGTIEHGIQAGFFKNIDEITNYIDEVNLYTQNSKSADIAKNFVIRLFEKVDVKDEQRSILINGAISLLSSSDREFGLISNKNAHLEIFNRFSPKGTLNLKTRKEDTKKLIMYSMSLIDKKEVIN